MQLDEEMTKLMAASQPVRYTVVTDTTARNKPGGGWTTGKIKAGSIEFTPISFQNGWVEYAPNRWIPSSACKPIGAVDPLPDEESPFVSAILVRADGTRLEFDLVVRG